ncbi:MAG: TraR/DksA family transcriptional regulator [Candidatus Omnitrophica bacterium]|nr:TraR/DksA family transcriptional regulator [Candidatus Omnitrophota bacterium]MBU4457863.1 TraR/DksA family transcriptional regulator [Candidatus Omnitrophota bacterium]
MNKRETTKFKKQLLEKREEMAGDINSIAKENMKSIKEASGDLSGYSFHMADMASDSYDREFSLNIASGEQEVIYEIDEALKRIKEGKYGKCESCDKKIPVRRLKAVPYAKHCIQCQSKEEKNKR